MKINEELIDKVEKLLACCTTIKALKDSEPLKDVSLGDLHAALRTSKARGQVRAGDLLDRDTRELVTDQTGY